MNFWSNPPDVGGKVEEEEKAAIYLYRLLTFFLIASGIANQPEVE
jgi:hypothetical protein